MKHVLFAAVSATVLLLCSEPAAKVYIDIHAPSATRMPIIVPPFTNLGETNTDPGALAANMAGVISDDLDFSGFFRILDPGVLDEEYLRGLTRSRIRWDMLSIIGAEAVVTGGLELQRFNKLKAELRLFDAVQGKFITGKRYKASVDEHRHIAHRFSNEIFSKLTGEPACFDTQIACVQSTGTAKELMIMDYDGKQPRTITRYNSLCLSPAWSPDARQIAFTSYKDGNPDLYIKHIYKGTVTKVSRKQGINIAPAWSPDGKKIALTLSLNNGNSEIYTLTLPDGTLERMTRNWSTDVSPSWAPDGKRIAFVSSRSGSPQLYTLTLASGRIKRLTFDGNYNTSPAWSPRGDMIAFAGMHGGSFNICIVRADGSFFQQLTFGRGNNEDPSWSPDGRYLAFSSDRTGQKQIFIMRADGTGQKQITFGVGEKSDPDWSPGGSQ